MRAILNTDYYLRAGVGFTALNLLNMLLWAVGLYLPAQAYALALLVCLWPALRHRRLNALLVIGLLLVCVTITLLGPVTAWDARSIWMFHAKRIFVDGSLFAPLDNYAAFSHNEYPVLAPAIAASLARSLGYWNEIVPRASVAIALAPPLFLAAYIFRSFAAFCVWIALLMRVCAADLVIGYMDCLVATNAAVAVLAVAEIYRRGADRQASDLAGPALALAASLLNLLFIKNEGSVVGALLVLAMVPAVIRHPKMALSVLLPWLVFALLWKLPVAQAGISVDLVKNGGLLERGLRRLQTPDDVFLILQYFKIYSLEYFVLLGLAMGVAALGWRKLWFVLPSLATVAAYVGVVFLVYLTTFQDLRWHLATSSDRVLIAFDLSTVSLLLYIVYRALVQAPPAWRPRADSGA